VTWTQKCPWSQAVENGSIEAVRLLLDHGASLSATAALYDGATPLELARRLRSEEHEQIAGLLEAAVQGRAAEDAGP
jgi:ankyrin repeat protein